MLGTVLGSGVTGVNKTSTVPALDSHALESNHLNPSKPGASTILQQACISSIMNQSVIGTSSVPSTPVQNLLNVGWTAHISPDAGTRSCF